MNADLIHHTDTSLLSYQRCGSGARPVILLHAGASSPAQWQALMNDVAGKDEFTLFAPASHGHGGSRRVDGRPATTADDIAALSHFIDTLAPHTPVDLVGHSYGGAIALWLAQRRPHRVRSITLFEPVLFDVLDVGGRRADHDAVARFAVSQIAAVEAGDIDGAAQDFISYWNGRDAWSRLSETHRARVAASMPTMADAWRQIWRRDTDLPALARLAAPIRLLHGTRTAAATFAVIEALRRVLPKATHGSVSGAGHMGPITHAEEVTRLVLAALYDAAPARHAVALPLAA